MRRKSLTAQDQLALAETVNNKFNGLNTKEDQQAFAEVIVDQIREDIMRDNLIDAMGVISRTFAFNETMQFKTTRGTKAFIHEPGSPAPRSTFQNRVHYLDAEFISVRPTLELGEIQSGRYGSVADIREFAMEEIQGKKYNILWNTLINSVATTDANYWSVSSSGTPNAKVNAIDSGLDYVADIPGSMEVAIVGRRSALKFLSKHEAYQPANFLGPSNRKMEELDYNLYPGQYRGVPVIMLNQYQDGWGMNNITDNEIMILGKNTLYMGVKEELGMQQWVDGATLEWNLHLYTRCGFGVFFPERNARIKLS